MEPGVENSFLYGEEEDRDAIVRWVEQHDAKTKNLTNSA